jgi:putative transposase
MQLNLRRRARRRLPKRERAALDVPTLPDSVWSADFMADALICGRRLRTFKCDRRFQP